MGTDLVAGSARPPGLFSSTDLREMLEQFSIFEENGKQMVNRRPSAVERQQLTKALQELAPSLQPFSTTEVRYDLTESDGRQRKVKATEVVQRSLAVFFAGYPSLQNADVPGLITAYMHDLRTMPVFAILRAFELIKTGQVTDRDERTGREVPLNPDWPPTSVRVYGVAAKVLHDPMMRELKIRRLLGPVVVAQAEISDEERARVGVKLRTFAGEFARRSAEPQMTEAQRIDANEREAQRLRQIKLGTEREILRQYSALGIEPVRRGDGELVSPGVARQMRPDLFINAKMRS